jgi:hypothetical protein
MPRSIINDVPSIARIESVEVSVRRKTGDSGHFEMLLKWVPALAHQNSEEHVMKERVLTIPELILIAGTRVALGVGIGLLLVDKLTDHERRGAGWALVAVGALSTVPIAMNILGKSAGLERGLTHA